MINVDNLTKRFGGTTAVDNISFEVEQGEIVGFLGPNGAGKTTTMRMLTGFIPPTGGTMTVAGFDVIRESLEVRRKIGYLPENVPIYKDMRVIEYLTYRGKLKGLRGRRLKTRLKAVLEDCGLVDVRKKVVGRLSKGYVQRVGLADALVHEPELLILDEPTIGLDPNQIRHIRNLIKSLAQKHTVLLSSHILPEVEMICERVMIINKGRIVASDSPDKLVSLMRGNTNVVMELKAPEGEIKGKFSGVKGVVNVIVDQGGAWHRVTCECRKGEDPRPALFEIVSSSKWELRELRVVRKNLEDVFVEITGIRPDDERFVAEKSGK